LGNIERAQERRTVGFNIKSSPLSMYNDMEKDNFSCNVDKKVI